MTRRAKPHGLRAVPTGAVHQLVDNRRVLQRNTVGGLTSVTAAGVIDDATRARAGELGLQISRASLQQLVAAYGASEIEPLDVQEV